MNNFDDLYLIDLSYLTSPADIVYDLTSILDTDAVKNKRIKISIGDITLNKSQLLSLKSLINSVNSSLSVLEGSSEITREAAISAGLVFQNTKDGIPEEYMPKEITENKEYTELTAGESALEVMAQTSEEADFDKKNEDSDNTEAIDNNNPDIDENKIENAVETSEHTTEDLPENKDYENTPDPELAGGKEQTEGLDFIYSGESKMDDLFASENIDPSKFSPLKDVNTFEENEFTSFDFELESFEVKYLKQNVCEGQFIQFDGNLVIIGDCKKGSEIRAAGDITVWGNLEGNAFAGCNGNEKARIRALGMNAQNLRIAGHYMTKPGMLDENGVFVPEEARVEKGEIGVYKIFS